MNFSQIKIRILVNHFEECFDFYTQILGLEVFWGGRSGPFASFKADGADTPCLSMFLAENQTMYKGYTPPSGSGLTDKVIYVIPTRDLQSDYEKLLQKGVEFIGKPQRMDDWFMSCVYFRDPEGNLFELCQDDSMPSS